MLVFKRALLNMHIMLGHSLSLRQTQTNELLLQVSQDSQDYGDSLLFTLSILPCQHTILKTADWLVDSQVTLSRSCHVYKSLLVKSSRANKI